MKHSTFALSTGGSGGSLPAPGGSLPGTVGSSTTPGGSLPGTGGSSTIHTTGNRPTGTITLPVGSGVTLVEGSPVNAP